jgi:hypothetical protein
MDDFFLPIMPDEAQSTKDLVLADIPFSVTAQEHGYRNLAPGT